MLIVKGRTKAEHDSFFHSIALSMMVEVSLEM